MIPGWFEALGEVVATRLAARGGMSARELAESLGVSERAAVSYIAMLAAAGHLTIERVAPCPGPDAAATSKTANRLARA